MCTNQSIYATFLVSQGAWLFNTTSCLNLSSKVNHLHAIKHILELWNIPALTNCVSPQMGYPCLNCPNLKRKKRRAKMHRCCIKKVWHHGVTGHYCFLQPMGCSLLFLFVFLLFFWKLLLEAWTGSSVASLLPLMLALGLIMLPVCFLLEFLVLLWSLHLSSTWLRVVFSLAGASTKPMTPTCPFATLHSVNKSISMFKNNWMF